MSKFIRSITLELKKPVKKRHIGFILFFLFIPVVLGFAYLFQSKETFTAVASDSGPYTVKVLAIGFNPTDETGNIAERYFNLDGKTSTEAADSIFNGTIDAFKRLSNNTVNYEIAHRMDITAFPEYTNGYQFTVDNYGECVWGRPEFNPDKCEQQKHSFDHNA